MSEVGITQGAMVGKVDSSKGIPAISVKMGGYSYDLKHSARCAVCNSEARFAIERGIILSRSYASIYRSLESRFSDEGSPEYLSVEQIRNHAQKHMDETVSIRQEMVEQHRKELGLAVDAANGTLIDAYSAAFEVMRLGYEKLVQNPDDIEVSHLLSAAKMVNEMEQTQAANLNTEAQTQLLSLLLSHVYRVMSQEQFDQLTESFRNDPLFIALQRQLRPNTLPSSS